MSNININACLPDESVAYRRQLLKNSLIELSKWFFELGPMWKWPMERLEGIIVTLEGDDAIQSCLDNHQGVLIITPHHGNWELAGLDTSKRFPMTIMYKPPGIKALEGHMLNARARAGAKLVGIDRNGLKAMISALKNGEAVGMLPDQEPKDGAYVMAPFFGIEARTMTLSNKLVRKTGAAIFIASTQRLPGGKGFALKYIPVAASTGDEDDITAATRLNQELEKVIMQCPEQYLWAYKRFKFRPEGSPEIYKN